MFGLKMGELLIIFLVILVLFGGTKLPQLGSSLGQAIRNFKKGFGADADAQAEAQRRTRSPRRLGREQVAARRPLPKATDGTSGAGRAHPASGAAEDA